MSSDVPRYAADRDFLPLDSIPQIAAGVPNAFAGLRVAFFIVCANRYFIFSRALRRPGEFPGSERVWAQVFSEVSWEATLSAVG